MRWFRYSLVVAIAALPVTVPPTEPTESTEPVEPPAATIVNDEGGPVTITGSVTYTDPFFLEGTAEPLVILEDQAGFVDRDRGFVMPEESQVIGQITSDVFTSPFTYSLSLPIEPQASLRDVDQDGETDEGVMVYAVAYWTNTWGDPYLEERDLQGGGWSTVYASTRIDPDPSAEGEVIGGTYLVFAPDDQQGFPSGFGADGVLFTDDDPIVRLPQGYTVVNLDTTPFTFDRSAEVTIDLIEGEQAALDDFSDLSYTDAFDAMIEMFRTRYAFTELQAHRLGRHLRRVPSPLRRGRGERRRPGVPPRAARLHLVDPRRPRRRVVRIASTPCSPKRPTVVSGWPSASSTTVAPSSTTSWPTAPPTRRASNCAPRSSRSTAGRSTTWSSETVPWSSPFSTEHVRRLQQLRYATRFPVDTAVDITYHNPGDTEPTTVTLTTVAERESFESSSFNAGLTGVELPLEFSVLDSGFGYVPIYSFFDNQLLTIQLWERMIQALNDNEVPGLIIDLRQNGGGAGFLADQMAAYFFDEPLTLGNTGFYDESLGEFYFDPATETAYIPPPEDLRYHRPITVLVGPNCNSACEFFAYDLTLEDRATVVGQYPTAGLGGSVEVFAMPEDETLQFTNGRAVDGEGQIHIEGKGVPPSVRVPVDEDTLFSDGDPVLDAAIAQLDEATAVDVVDGGEIAIGDTVTGEFVPRTRVRYTLAASAGDDISIFLRDDDRGSSTPTCGCTTRPEHCSPRTTTRKAATTVNSALEGLVVPEDMTLIIEVATYDDSGEGAYTLEVVASQ